MHAVRGLFTTADGIDPEGYVVVRYRIETGKAYDLRAAAARLALVASIGTVSALRSESSERRISVGPRILHPAKPGTESSGEVVAAFPVSLFAGRDPLAQLMSVTMFGAEYNYANEIRVESIDLPRRLLADLRGPVFGISGLRQRFGVTSRPILAAILKPRLGVSLLELAAAAQEALAGGVDIVMDDELVVDPEGDCAFVPRVTALVQAADRASATTGQLKRVVVNVSARPAHTWTYAKQAFEMGAAGFIFNAFVCGIPALQDLSEANWGVPVFACNVGSGLLTRSSTGVASSVYCRLSRLAGADAVQTGIVAGDAYTTEAWGPSVIALDRSLGHINPSLPIVAGGLNIANLWRNWRSLGNDVIFAAGSGIFGYPGGPGAGAEALRKLLENLSPEMSGKEAADETVRLAQGRGSAVARGLEAYGFDPDALARLET